MEQQKQELHFFFFPFMGQGHILPTIDMAKRFSSCASRSVRCTILATPLKSISIANSISTFKKIGVQIINFPVTAGVPEGIETPDECTSDEMLFNFMKGLAELREPVERLLEEFRPDCLVADFFFPWATDAAAKFNIPRLLFYGSSIFKHCAEKCVNLYKPYMDVSSDYEPFVVPNLPHEIKLTTAQIIHDREQKFPKTVIAALESDLHCYGTIFNSFYDLEADYFNHYINTWKKNIWCVGPLSLQSNKDTARKISRGKKAAIDENECLKWLDSQKPDSVIYICFGTETYLSSSQLYQIAVGIEASQQPFIWVVRRRNKNNEEEEEVSENDKCWFPEGFEERMKGKGLILREWAPQVLILDHDSVGGFVTHCGWNSTLEGICGGVAMVTWPNFGDQFYNEKLVTEVLKIGVSVGVKEYTKPGHRFENDGIMSDVIEKAVKTIFKTEEGKEMRRRAKELKKKAKMAGEEGGSSYNDINALFDKIYSFKVVG